MSPRQRTKDRNDLRKRMRSSLEERRAQLSDEVRGQLEELQSPDQEQLHVADMEDYGRAAYDDETPYAILEQEGDELEQVEWALRRLDEGTYGTCEDCGEEISAERLEALPLATTCVDCQRAEERARPPERGSRPPASR